MKIINHDAACTSNPKYKLPPYLKAMLLHKTKPVLSNLPLGLATKFILLVSVILALTLGLSSAWTQHTQKQLITEHLQEKAALLGHFVSLISADAILGYDFVTLEHFAAEISRQRDMVYGVILDVEDNALTSYLDNKHPLIASTQKKLGEQANFDNTLTVLRLYPRIQHLEFPILNAGERIGTVAVGVDTLRVRQQAVRIFLEQIGVALSIILFLSLSIYWVFRTYALLPIQQLVEGSRRIRQGDFSQPVETLGRDELGKLGKAFNAMMRTLSNTIEEKDTALRQLHELNRTLESRVQQRTEELQRANQSITQLNQRLRQDNQRMSAELDITRHLQEMVLPTSTELNSVEGLEIATFSQPADEVSGDYYDVLQYNGQVKIAVGDVTGHGLESGLTMLMVQTAVRTLLAADISDYKLFMAALNRAMFDNLQRMQTDKNLTLVLLDYAAGKITVTGQHEDIILVRQNGSVEKLETFDLGFIIGLEPDISSFIAQTQVELQKGDGLVLYTDGITEAWNEEGELYGLKRMCNVVKRHWASCSATELQNHIIQDVERHAGQQKVYDDMTLLVLKQLV